MTDERKEEIEEILNDFEDYMLEEELAKNTRESYLYTMKEFFYRYDELNKKNVIAWKNELQTRLKPDTVNLRLSAIEKYCKFKGVEIPVKRVKKQQSNRVENVITPEQYERLVQGLEADGNTRWVVIIKIMAKTGARISEALRFTKKDLETGHVDLYTKGKVRRVYFPKSLADELTPYTADLNDNDVLCTNRKGEPLTSKGVYSQLRKLAERYGIPEENAHPHSFRHFFAIEFLKRNPNISLLADLLGHSSVNATMIYLRMSQTQQREAIDDAVNW